MFSYLVLEFLCNQDGDKSVRCRILLCNRPIFLKQITSRSEKIFQENCFSSTPNFAGSNSKNDSTPCNSTGSWHGNIDVVHPSSQVVHQSSQIPTTVKFQVIPTNRFRVITVRSWKRKKVSGFF